MEQGWFTVLSLNTCYEKVQGTSRAAVCVYVLEKAETPGTQGALGIACDIQTQRKSPVHPSRNQTCRKDGELWLYSTDLLFLLKLR